MLKTQLTKDILDELLKGNIDFSLKNKDELIKHVDGQNPKAIVITCSDSRVIPEFIFNRKIGEIFVIRVAGNVTIDPSILASIEYGVDYLNIPLLIILGHSNCGAVKAAEESIDCENPLLEEIKKGFSLNDDHIIGNLKYQYRMIFQRSKIISNAVSDKKLKVIPAIYNIKKGKVEVLNFD